MFNSDDEVRSALTKMYEYSPVDGFAEISDGLGSMIKSLANEPSVGLFYVQQHTHNAVPNVVNLRNNIAAKSREISLHTEDSDDSIAMVRSMADCGLPIVDDMIKDIRKSLTIVSSKQPRKGLISSRPGSGFKTGRTGSWGGTAWRVINVGEELPVSSGVGIGNEEGGGFDEFKGGKEERFEEWLEGGDDSQHKRGQ